MGVLVGCALPQPEKVELSSAGVSPDASVADLAAVLSHCIGADGFVDVEKYETVADKLDAQLERWTVTGPTASPGLYPTPADRLAYWYNARIAWSMYLGMRRHEAERSGSGLDAISFPLDGRTMTLGQIDGEIQVLGGPAAVVAAPGILLCRAALPSEPFTGADVAHRINARVMASIDDGQRFVVDYKTQQVKFPPVVWQYRQEILDRYRQRYGDIEPTLTTALLPLTDGQAHWRLQNAIGYACVENTGHCALAINKW